MTSHSEEKATAPTPLSETDDSRLGSEARSKNQLKNDAKRADKMAKFAAKLEKLKNEKKEPGATKPKEATASARSAECDSVAVVATPEGQKKDMSQPMASAYHPKAVESGWYSWWQASGVFKPEVNPTGPIYVIPIPPPNVTGSLHLGHAMATSIQDALTRKRMQGYAALYVPGCDHAGISCQVVVEKDLKKKRNLTRQDLGREAFVAEVWKWKNAYGDRIYEQFKRLGGSMDWDRAKFTLDPSMVEAVNEAFVTLFDQGIIYRDDRLVNWCGKLQTTVSDLEVDHREIGEPARLSAFGHDAKKLYQFGLIYDVAYKVADGTSADEICVSTTRPETIPGDVGVAIHPEDPRYLKYHGRSLIHPIHKTSIPIVLDTYVDREFGTGAVKLTPGHDLNDFELASRHNLAIVSIYDEHNRLNDRAGPLFKGMMRFDAREAVLAFLKEQDLYRGSRPHPMTIPICNRSGDIIEPRILPQWWMKCKDVAARAVEAVKEKKLRLIPSESEKIWFNWLENCRDWCLSRQLWWGHRVPAYSVQTRVHVDAPFCHALWVSGRTLDEATEKALRALGATATRENVRLDQDADVLDTWFSSALWPFATLGWPNVADADFQKFYPTSVLETGRDIIFFWVARMVMMGIQLTGSVPFHTVFLHSIVRDAHGRKMSKSLGNVIDPIDVIEGITLAELQRRVEEGNLDASEVARAKESQKRDFPNGIKECGTDALRFALCNYTSQGSDINLDILRVEGYRRFCNKLWNACRFALMKFGPAFVPTPRPTLNGQESLYDAWILGKLNLTVADTNRYLEDYNFMKATSAIYNFLLYDLCDVYIEAVKPMIQPEHNHDPVSNACKNTLYTCIETGLQLLHPFMPFITEELYQRLPRRQGDITESISITRFPTERSDWAALSQSSEPQVAYLQSIVHAVRSAVNDHQLKGAIEVRVAEAATGRGTLIEEHSSALYSLIKGLRSIRLGVFSDDAPSSIGVELEDQTKIQVLPLQD